MIVDFFKPECQKTTNERKFGLYDAEDNTPVIIKLTDESSWNATVINNERKSVRFTAIDNCIDIVKENGKMDSRCDGMLTYDTTLLLIELKNKRGSWQTEGLSQIENVAKIMIEQIPDYYNGFKRRKAIVANRKYPRPGFRTSNKEIRQRFFTEFKMRIQFESEIIIK